MAKSKEKAKEEAKDDKKKGGALKLVLGAILLLVAGAGGAYGAFAAGLIGTASEPSGPDVPKLVRKGESDPYAPADDKGKDAVTIVHGEGGSEYRTAYYSFDGSFTSNLANSPALIQVDIAASTQHDGRVLQWLATHELAIRSAILGQLAATPEEDVFDVAGRERLAKRLTLAINEVLEDHEGFGGVDAVHFEAFLVQ